jgi:group I intron endonuclease
MGNPQPSPKSHNMGIIYCLTSPSGKRYIGQTKRSLNKRISEHAKCSGSCILLENAIKKYGIQSFLIECIFDNLKDELLDEYEVKCVEIFDTLEPAGYNIRVGGGSGSTHSVESKQRMRESKLGSKNHNFGKPRSESCKLAISNAKSGENHHFFGKEFTYEHKLNLSKSHKNDELPMYMVFVKERPEQWQAPGYAILNHPQLKTKYFTSKKLSLEDKYKLAFDYLQSCDMDAVQRLNGDGFLPLQVRV